MKKLFLIAILFANLFLQAQNDGFNYKALITDNGSALANQDIDVRFTILENGSTIVYEETQNTTTDANGIIILNIGEGSVETGDFSTINWANEQFLKVEINTGNGFVEFGTTVMRYVPKAKYADEAGNVFSRDFNDLINIPDGLSDGDDDTHLTEAEVDAYVSNNGYLTSEVDGSTTNELQNLSLNGKNLSISNGTGVSFAGWDADTTDDVKELNDLSDARTTDYGVFIGDNSGTNANVSGDLVGIGNNIMLSAVNADYSVAIGNYALESLTSGRYNTVIGHQAGYALETGSGNVFIGYNAGYSETGSNKLYIANSGTSTPLIGGDFSTNEVTINGSLTINDGTQGTGKILISDANGKASWSNNLPTQTKTLVLGPENMQASSDNSSVLIRNYIYGAYMNTSTQGGWIITPINLPVGCVIQSVKVYYVDNSSNDIGIYLVISNISDGTYYNIGYYKTTSSYGTVRYYNFYNLNHTLTSTESFAIQFWPYNGDSVDNWDFWHLAIKGIVITYTE